MRVETLVAVQILAEAGNRPVVDIQVEVDSLVEMDSSDNLVVEGRAEKDNHLGCILVVSEHHRNIGC